MSLFLFFQKKSDMRAHIALSYKWQNDFSSLLQTRPPLKVKLSQVFKNSPNRRLYIQAQSCWQLTPSKIRNTNSLIVQ